MKACGGCRWLNSGSCVDFVLVATVAPALTSGKHIKKEMKTNQQWSTRNNAKNKTSHPPSLLSGYCIALLCARSWVRSSRKNRIRMGTETASVPCTACTLERERKKKTSGIKNEFEVPLYDEYYNQVVVLISFHLLTLRTLWRSLYMAGYNQNTRE